MNAASNGSAMDCASWTWSAVTETVWSPHVPPRRSPRRRIASTCSGHWSIRVTSSPALASSPPTTQPIAPAPTMPILVFIAR